MKIKKNKNWNDWQKKELLERITDKFKSIMPFCEDLSGFDSKLVEKTPQNSIQHAKINFIIIINALQCNKHMLVYIIHT